MIKIDRISLNGWIISIQVVCLAVLCYGASHVQDLCAKMLLTAGVETQPPHWALTAIEIAMYLSIIICGIKVLERSLRQTVEIMKELGLTRD